MNRPTSHDYLSLLACKAAKLGKNPFVGDPRRFYDSFFSEEHIEQYQKDIRNILKHREIDEVFSNVPGGSVVVDVGCGVGHVLRNLKGRYHKFGMDLSFMACRLARKGGLEGGEVLTGSIYRIPLRNSSVDVVVCLEVLEHLEDDAQAVAEISRILRPGGILLLSLPGTYYFPEYKELLGHLRHYTREAAVRLIASHGLKADRDIEGYDGVQKKYFYAYVLLQAVNRLMNFLCHRNRSIYRLSLPGASSPLYDSLVIPWAEKEAAKVKSGDRSSHPSVGVFLVASKEAKACSGEPAVDTPPIDDLED